MFKRGDSWYSDFVHDGKRYTKSWGKLSRVRQGRRTHNSKHGWVRVNTRQRRNSKHKRQATRTSQQPSMNGWR